MVERTQPCIATWCPVCDKRVSDKGKDTDRLLAHVRRNHQKIYGDQRSERKEHIEGTPNRRFSNSTKLTSLSCGKKKDRKKIYATCVDTWTSHNEKKICPQCRNEAVPALHTRRDKMTSSHMAAICLLGCWPFCFIPLMKRSKKVRMICPSCGFAYGTFEYQNNGLKPCQEDDSEIKRLPSSMTSFRACTKACVSNPTKVECDRPRNDAKERSSWLVTKGFSKRIWPFVGNKKRKSVFSTRVETWRYHDKNLLCPVCNEEALPIVFTKRHKYSRSRLGATCLLGCWPLCFVPLMLSRERQVRLVCPFCGHNYGNHAYEMKSTEANETKGELTCYADEERNNLRRNSNATVRVYQELWEVQDVSQQTDNAEERTRKEVEGEEEEEEEEEEERRRRRSRGASGPGVTQNPLGETTSPCSEACTYCSKQVTLDPRYEIQTEPTDLDYDYDDTDFKNMCRKRWDSDFYTRSGYCTERD